jgi:alpha-galactosidase
MMCDKPRLSTQPVYGINDWYYAYGNNNPDLILRQTSLMTGLATDTANRPFSVVDAGWAFYSPLLPGDSGWMDDFSRPNDKFKDMGRLAADIKKEGMRPGLWMRPLCASYKDPATLLLPAIPGRNDPKTPVLDPSIEENQERVRRNILLYREWGYELVKHDYSTYDIFGKWGSEMAGDVTTPGWRFRDNTRTTAEIVLALYRHIRGAAGSMYVIGCNTLSHLSAGLFELNRIGDDTSGKEWARTRKMGVNTLGFRMIQHDNFYAADGDCVGLTKDIPWNKNKQWMQLLASSGCPLFISAQPDMLGAEQKATIRASFAQAARPLPVGEPLDWLTNTLPSKWKLNGKVREFDWA